MTMKQIKSNGIPTNMGLDHFGIVVPNAQEAANFFIEVFDAEFDWEVKREVNPTAGERGWSKIFDVHPDAYLPHVIMLKCGSNPLCQYIEIFEWCAPDQNKPIGKDGWYKFSDLGNSYISFTVKDIEKVIAHIKTKVIPKWEGTRLIQDPPMQFPLRGEICTSTYLVSPWGMWIEITCWSKSKILGTLITPQQYCEKNPNIGVHVNELPTPSFLVDLDVIDHNIALMRKRIVDENIKWRVPSKAHQCPELAKYILNKGNACGVVLLTLNEAEKFAAAGIDDIYLANQVINKKDLQRLAVLAKQIKSLRVSIDNAEFLKNLSAEVQQTQGEIIKPIEVLIELNINHHRNGVNNISEAVYLAKLTKQIEIETGTVKFAGVTGYEGHTPILPPHKKTMETKKSHQILKNAKAAIEAQAIEVNIVSAGGSCNYIDCLNTNVLTEIQAGGAALGDLLYFHKANLKSFGHRMGSLILTQITSVPADQSRAIADAGFKSIGWHPFGGLPELRDRKDLCVFGLSAEHVRIKQISSDQPLQLARGDKLMLIPGYTDAMGFLHEEIYAIRNNRVEHVWKTI